MKMLFLAAVAGYPWRFQTRNFAFYGQPTTLALVTGLDELDAFSTAAMAALPPLSEYTSAALKFATTCHHPGPVNNGKYLLVPSISRSTCLGDHARARPQSLGVHAVGGTAADVRRRDVYFQVRLRLGLHSQSNPRSPPPRYAFPRLHRSGHACTRSEHGTPHALAPHRRNIPVPRTRRAIISCAQLR